MLSRCDLVVSTAIQENFGIAVVEAILAGCQPVLPDRLAYPEIIPPECHRSCLYADDHELFGRLARILDGRERLSALQLTALQGSIERLYGLKTGVSGLDDALERLWELSDSV
jgi:glycosyltransferase involved in cell wall biosynthesis